MNAPTWDETAPLAPTGPSWDDTAAAMSRPAPGKLESLGRGAVQGATLGYSDELTGGVLAAKDKLLGEDGSIGDLYRKERDDSRGANAAAESANPWTYKAGEFGGGIASLAVAPEISGLKGMAALGAVSGLGNSTADLTKGEFGKAAEDTGLSAGLGAAGYGVGKLAAKVPGAVASGTKKALSSVFGPSMEAIDARLANPAAIRNAGEQGLEGIAEKIPGAMTNLRGQIASGAEAAGETLSPDLFNSPGVMTKKELVSQINALQNEMKTGGVVVGGADEAAFKRLEAIKGKIQGLYSGKKGLAAQFSDRIPETDLKSIIQSIDPDINWSAPENKPINVALERLRGGIDSSLKDANPDYKSAMGPVADKQELYSYLQRKFNLKPSAGGELSPSDATLSNLKNVLNEGKGVTQDYLGRLKDATGTDVANDVQNYKYAQEFQGGRMNGSRNAVTGAAVGGAIGHFLPIPGASWVGSAAGALAGRQIDREGGAMAGHMIDWYVEHRPQVLGKYAPVLQDALKRGTQALTAAHYVLQQQDPNYNVMLRTLTQ